MLALALVLLIGGWLLVYSGVRNVNPIDEIKGAFSPAAAAGRS